MSEQYTNTARGKIIRTDIPGIRDPFVVVGDDGTYYAYGTGWKYYKNTTGSLSEGWTGPYDCVEIPEEADDNFWAPEVHRYQGAYYMFTTYHSRVTGRRGCTVLRSESPEGPFREITGGQITPRDWDCIDGTLYVDPDGQPWMVFVHEWVSAPEQLGRMAAAKLSGDLTRFVSEPIELFTARDASWARGNVTDGCFLYTTEEGDLLMLWSNWDTFGYCVGIARSDNGKIDGHWTQDGDELYSGNMTGEFDGGHGMIFTDKDGQKYLSMHSPNGHVKGHVETPAFLPVRDTGHTLVWDTEK